MKFLSLHHLTVFDATPLELVSIAAETGCQGVCVFVHSPSPERKYPLLEAAQKDEMARRMKQTGIAITNLEVFYVDENPPFEAMRRAMDLGAELGAKRAVVHIHDIDRPRALGNFVKMCDLAGSCGLVVGLEFWAYAKGCDSLPKAVSFIADAGRPNAGIAIDCLHFTRTGSKPADLKPIKPEWFSYTQLCDGPLSKPREEWMDEARGNRIVPGEGEFPLVEIMSLLPPGIATDVEVPLHRLRDQGVSALERARFAVAGARRVLKSSGGD